jgi:hypothetical protein
VSEPPPCNEDIYASGTLVMMTHTIGSEQMERWVKKVAERSGQPVDWHFAGGRACILALGDLEKVRSAIQDLLPEHNDIQRQAAEDILPSHPFSPSYTLYGDGEWNPAHEYARRVNAGNASMSEEPS